MTIEGSQGGGASKRRRTSDEESEVDTTTQQPQDSATGEAAQAGSPQAGAAKSQSETNSSSNLVNTATQTEAPPPHYWTNVQNGPTVNTGAQAGSTPAYQHQAGAATSSSASAAAAHTRKDPHKVGAGKGEREMKKIEEKAAERRSQSGAAAGGFQPVTTNPSGENRSSSVPSTGFNAPPLAGHAGHKPRRTSGRPTAGVNLRREKQLSDKEWSSIMCATTPKAVGSSQGSNRGKEATGTAPRRRKSAPGNAGKSIRKDLDPQGKWLDAAKRVKYNAGSAAQPQVEAGAAAAQPSPEAGAAASAAPTGVKTPKAAGKNSKGKGKKRIGPWRKVASTIRATNAFRGRFEPITEEGCGSPDQAGAAEQPPSEAGAAASAADQTRTMVHPQSDAAVTQAGPQAEGGSRSPTPEPQSPEDKSSTIRESVWHNGL